MVLRDSFTEAFAFQLSHSYMEKVIFITKNLQRIVAKVATEIEQRNQSTLIL